MHLRFTEEELGVLIDMISLAAEVASLNRRSGAKERFARFEELENTILEKVMHLGINGKNHWFKQWECVVNVF